MANGFERAFGDFENAIQSLALREVAGHWRELCASGQLPGWIDIRPSALRKHLSIVWSYDYLPDEDDFVGKLAGHGIAGVSSEPFKGTRLSALRPGDKYPRSLIRAKRVLHEPALYHGKGLVYMTANSPGVGERIVMPLQGRGTQSPGIFGATEYKNIAEWKASEMGAEVEEWFSLEGAFTAPA
jgi:hypothetical protein